MSGPVLLAVAHGSSHPRSAAAVGALASQVRRLAPVIDIRTAFVQHGEPSPADGPAAAGPDGRPSLAAFDDPHRWLLAPLAQVDAALNGGLNRPSTRADTD